jgi:branched-chain amino acid transport system substrate-binding protein
MKIRLIKIILLITGALWTVVALVGGMALAADTIKIGVAGAHSGDLASYGIPSKRAAELVVKEINAKGVSWAKRSKS